MSNLPQQSTIKQYLADGATLEYTYPFMILLPSDINVYVTLSGNNANPLVDFVPSSQYTVSGETVVTGGEITFLVAPPANAIVTLVRNMQISIDTQFANAQNYTGENLDDTFQRIGLIMQQLQGYNYTDYPNGSIGTALQYQVNERLLVPPDSPPITPIILPSLTRLDGEQVDGLVWVGQGGGITVTQLFPAGGSIDTFAALLASQTPGAPGASLVGYYDINNNVGQTVDTFLNNLPTYITDIGLDNQYVTATRLQEGYAVYGADIGIVNAIEVVTTPPLAVVVTAGTKIRVKIANTNTSAATINPNGTVYNVKYTNGAALTGGELVAGMMADFEYDGTNWQLINPSFVAATNAETLAGVITNRPVVPAGLASGYNIGGSSIALPGGLIMKWGASTIILPGATQTIAFPVPFPTGVLTWAVVPNTPVATDNIWFGVSSITAANITIVNGSGSTIAANTTFHFMVMGY